MLSVRMLDVTHMKSCEWVMLSVLIPAISLVHPAHTKSCEWVMLSVRMLDVTHGTHTNGSRHTYEWYEQGGPEKLLVWMSHVTHRSYERDVSHIWTCRVTRMWMSHVTYTNVSCHSYEWCVQLQGGWELSLVWMSHVTHVNTSCRTYKRIMSLIWVRHGSPIYMNESRHHSNHSCHSYEWVTSLVWMVCAGCTKETLIKMNHVTRVNVSCHTYKWVMFLL